MTAAGMILVVGGGTMGAGIAQSFATAGATVKVIETSPEAAERAMERVTCRLDAGALARIGVTDSWNAWPEADLAIEAVPEEISLKRDVLRTVEGCVSGSCLIASNTSSLSIDELAEGVQSSERFLGMHFFNPVPKSTLVELVTGDRTSPAAVQQARLWVRFLDKQCIEVRNSPGFATSRLGLTIGLEAIRMVEEGVASVEDIDRGMELGYRLPMGPLRLTDLVGLDVRLAIAEHLAGTLGSRFDPPALLRRMVSEGKLGRKSGQGFYTW